MNLPFELLVALRYIRAKRKAAVSLITMITIGGVAVGVAALTVVTSVWNGFEAEFLDKLLGINAHAVVLKQFDVFRNHHEVAGALAQEDGITYVSPFVYSEVIVQSPRGVSGVAIKGIDPLRTRTTPLSKYVPQEAFDTLAQTASTAAALPGILIGHELAKSLHVAAGDPVSIITPFGGKGGQPRSQSFRVAAVFHSGMFEFDSRMVFVNLREAQEFFRLFDTVTGLELWTRDPMTSQGVVGAALARLDPELGDFDLRDWSRTNRGLFGAVRQQKILISIVLGFIVLVAAFNIVATLILLILEKRREIAVLKSLGASNRSILAIFVVDGQIVGVLGCALGVLAGLAVCMVLEAYGLKLDPRVYYLENLPIVVEPLEVLTVALGALSAATLATLFPAYKAAKMPPVDGLRLGGLARESPAAVSAKRPVRE